MDRNALSVTTARSDATAASVTTAGSETTAGPRPRAAGRRALRQGRVLARLREGWAYEEIARAEAVTVERVRDIVGEILGAREIDDESEHARLQIARLEMALKAAGEAVAAGNIRAISPYLRVLDRLDRYRGRAAASQKDGDEMRRKLLAKLNRMAEARQEEKAEREARARLREALADSSIGEADGYGSEEARFFLNSNISP